ncbi:hypothetical protein [Aquabacterium sp. A08]|uniref:hypothetical protein n=1 Tax=Aquabacterium sp. A08 TaxID=2718532 RepID=UPI00141F2964|nr:hypothetical protein [Aquabacterium sp. A08]NIC41026.1 hypothetical protein [Aquabacterium sp. A08]
MRALLLVSPSLAGGVVLCAFAGLAQAAAPLQHAFSVTTGLEFDSNPALVAGGAGVQRWRANPQYTLSSQAGATEWSLVAAGQIERSDNAALSADRNDPSLRFAWQQASATSSLGLNASYVQASTRATEFEEFGFVTADRTQTTQGLGLSWRQAVAERQSLSASVNHQWVDYDTQALLPYRVLSGNAAWSLALSEQETLSLTLNAGRYTPGDSPLLPSAAASRQWGFMAGYAANLTPNLQWQVQGGLVRVAGANRDSTWQGGLQLAHKGQRLDTTLNLSRSVVTSAALTGFAPSNSLRAQWTYAVSDRTRGTFSVSHTRSAASGAAATSGSTVALGVDTELSPFWRAGVSVQHKTSRRAAVQANGHVVSATLTYTHPDF